MTFCQDLVSRPFLHIITPFQSEMATCFVTTTSSSTNCHGLASDQRAVLEKEIHGVEDIPWESNLNFSLTGGKTRQKHSFSLEFHLGYFHIKNSLHLGHFEAKIRPAPFLPPKKRWGCEIPFPKRSAVGRWNGWFLVWRLLWWTQLDGEAILSKNDRTWFSFW